jgi:hypothetical protein
MFRFAKRKGGNLPRQISIKIKSIQRVREQRTPLPLAGGGWGGQSAPREIFTPKLNQGLKIKGTYIINTSQ